MKNIWIVHGKEQNHIENGRGNLIWYAEWKFATPKAWTRKPIPTIYKN